MQTDKGFSLLELLIIVAIVSILVTLAFFGYQIYLARAQLTETMVFVGSLKGQVTTDIANNLCSNETSEGTYGIAAIGGIAPNCNISYTFKTVNVSPALRSKTLVLDISSNGKFTVNPSTTVSSIYFPNSIR
jgi:type IV pilus assembly protein PilA